MQQRSNLGRLFLVRINEVLVVDHQRVSFVLKFGPSLRNRDVVQYLSCSRGSKYSRSKGNLSPFTSRRISTQYLLR